VTRASLTRGAWIVAGATVLWHLATATIYSYHRDELYYLASGRRLAWGYADHPPLTPLLYRIGEKLFGSSPLGLHVMPALLHGAIVLLTALIARELGGSGRAQLVAALGAAVAPMFLTLGHFLATVTPEVALWSAATLLVLRILNGGDRRLWVAVGVVVGVAMLDKWTTVFLVAGLGVGLLLVPERRLLATPWIVAGAAVALALWVPNLIWQAQRGWPQLELSAHIRNYAQGLLTAPYQFVLLGVVSGMLALPGFLWLLRNPVAHRYRSLGIAFVVIVALVTLTGGKPYYAGVFGPVLIAAGAAAGAGPSGRLLPILLIATGLVIAPFAQPLLPVATADVTRQANQEVGEMLGWPELVDVVAGVYRHHPGATIFAANYSEAAAIEVLGRGRGLPQPISGHNTYWWWGHPHGRSDVTVVVGFPKTYLDQLFGDVELAATFHSPGVVRNMEDGTPIWICREQRADWDTLWATRIKHIQ
jgi:4-amino-4-deoxy-L-arabinose transferase-like glycosyltransferase